MAGKKFKIALAQVEVGKLYSLSDGVALAKKIATAKFDETVEVTMVLGVDPRKADQLVRGTIVLPHGLGKSKRVAVIAGNPDDGEKIWLLSPVGICASAISRGGKLQVG